MRKTLNIPVEQLSMCGDCTSSILYRLFEFNQASYWELLFSNDGHLQYIPATNPQLPFNSNFLLKYHLTNYLEQLENQYNIRIFELKVLSHSKIRLLIDNNFPLILNGRAIDMPWRGCNEINEFHSCLIIGYDEKKENYICIDPVFHNGLLYLPFHNLQFDDNKTKINYLDFSRMFKPIHYPLKLSENYFLSMDCKTYSSDSLKLLCDDIKKKKALGHLFDFNCHNYLLNNKTWFFLLARYQKIIKFFSYYSQNNPNCNLQRVVEAMMDCYNSMKIACSLTVKFSHTGEYDIIDRLIDRILKSCDREREANYFLQLAIKEF